MQKTVTSLSDAKTFADVMSYMECESIQSIGFYGISSVPTFIMVDREGKIIMAATNSSSDWQAKLAEIFE